MPFLRTLGFLLLSTLFLFSFSASAQLDDLLKQVVPQKSQKKSKSSKKKKKSKSKTEQLLGAGLKTIQGMAPIGYKEEMAIGGAVSLEAVARYGGLWKNPEVEKYIVTLGTAVAQVSDRSDIPYYFGILNSKEKNAFSCPGGYIFVTKGLLLLVQNEAQLAGILGHEIAHVAKKHALESIQRSKALSGLSELTLTALDKDPKMFDSIVKKTTNLLLESGLSQEDEFEADRLGTEYAYRVGYQPKELRSFLQTLDRSRTKAASAGWFKTHPDPRKRIAKLQTILRRAEYLEGKNLPQLVQRFQAEAGTKL